jgi:hypothetical protein
MQGGDKEEGEEEDADGDVAMIDLPEDPRTEAGFTYAEETRRQIAREDRSKKRKEAFEKAKSSCTIAYPLYLSNWLWLTSSLNLSRCTDRKQRRQRRSIQNVIHLPSGWCPVSCSLFNLL